MRDHLRATTEFFGFGHRFDIGDDAVIPNGHGSDCCTLQFGRRTADTELSPDRQLQYARRAMQDGQIALAEHFIQTAEALQQQFPSNLPMAYTPAMARQELANLKNRMNGMSTASPATATPPAATDTLAAAQRALLKARQALANGDVETATAMLKSASQYPVDFQKLGDSPEMISAMIERQNQLSELAKKQDRSYNAGAASFLLTQAEALIQYRDYENAELLVNQAQKFPVEFTSAIGDPEKLSQLIAKGRQAATIAATANSKPTPKSEVSKLLSQAQLAMDREEWLKAKSFIDRAKSFEIPESQFAANETRPWQLELKVQNALNRQNYDPNVIPTNFEGETTDRVIQADYVPETDKTQNVQVSGMTDGAEDFNQLPNNALEFYNAGLKALNASDDATAAMYFQKAWDNRDAGSRLDGITRKAIKEQLDRLIPELPEGTIKASLASQETPISLPNVDSEQQVMFRKLQSDVFRERAAAERALETNPREALEKMTMVRGRIAQSSLNSESQRPLLTIIDRDINEMQKYIEQNLPDIINDETNAARKDSVERRQQRRLDVEYQIQKLVEEFNNLMDEKRYAEAQIVSRQVSDLDPDSEIATLLREKAKFAKNYAEMTAIREQRSDMAYESLRGVEESMEPWNHDNTVVFGDAEKYMKNAERRNAWLNSQEYDSESERHIWTLLKQERVQGEYRGTLAEAMDQLSRQAGVNIVFDDMALTAEGIQKDRQIDIPIRTPISLKSALEVILSSAGLVFVVDSEVIKVTSRDAQNSKLKTETYYIGDLVMPMNQDFDPLQIRFNQPNSGGYAGNGAMNAMGGNSLQASTGPTNQLGLAQQIGNNIQGNPFGGFNYGGFGGGGTQTGIPTFSSMGGQPMGGVTLQDFQPLIDLIQNTIQNESWLDTGQGLGTIQAFVPNLSLIVSQTQEVQDEIQDLLKKLRELNDVQIVVEVRFITLRDEFFERVGVDFDFSLKDNNPPGFDPTSGFLPNGSTIVGQSPVTTAGGFTPTNNLDIQFLQDSFTAATPIFGGFDPATAANFGFAILSDIEVFFLIQASKGDQRTNIMQAPTVTMFNGQSANVKDGSARPFVTSVIPMVGDFAVAHQPVITMLPDGTNLNVTAVVSDDRRFVRLHLVPFFSQVTDVQTFTFDGSHDNRTNDQFGSGRPPRCSRRQRW